MYTHDDIVSFHSQSHLRQISSDPQDTKLALMMTSNMLHERFHRSTGISFSSIYPGAAATGWSPETMGFLGG